MLLSHIHIYVQKFYSICHFIQLTSDLHVQWFYFSELESVLLNQSMDPLRDNSNGPEDSAEYAGKTYALTQKQLNYLIASIVKNLSASTQNEQKIPSSVVIDPVGDNSVFNPALNNSVNMTSAVTIEDLSDDEKITMIFYVLVFFLWYGGLIFLCLIGFGVYKKPSSYETYRKFVDRKELREKLKQEKHEELEKRRMLRQSSFGSSWSGNSLDQSRSSYNNGGLNISSSSYNFYTNKSPRSVPSFALSSMVYSEEEEGLLGNGTPETTKPKSPTRNGQVIFEME